MFFDSLIDTVEGGEIMGLHSISQVGLCLLDLSHRFKATSDWALLDVSIFVFKDPGPSRATFGVELSSHTTVVLDVTEVELGTTALTTYAMSLLDALLDQSARFWVSGQVQGRVSPCILHG